MLFILSKSPQAATYSSILKIAKKIVKDHASVAVLLVQDACIAATMNEYCTSLTENGIDIYALKADCEARGLIERLSPKVKVIDYAQWVELVMAEHDRIVSWTS